MQLSEFTKTKRRMLSEFRKRFNRYDEEAEIVVRLMLRGKTNSEIHQQVGVPPSSMAAYRANFTRGVYNQYTPYLC